VIFKGLLFAEAGASFYFLWQAEQKNNSRALPFLNGFCFLVLWAPQQSLRLAKKKKCCRSRTQ
jgi:hypothetical protein